MNGNKSSDEVFIGDNCFLTFRKNVHALPRVGLEYDNFQHLGVKGWLNMIPLPICWMGYIIIPEIDDGI